jgi:hypothetical protein
MMLRNAVTAETGVKQFLKPPHKAAVALILRYDPQQHAWESRMGGLLKRPRITLARLARRRA